MNISGRALDILRFVTQRHADGLPTTTSTISTLLGMSYPNVTVVLQPLVNSGYAYFTRDPEDRRVKYIVPTGTGEEWMQWLQYGKDKGWV